MLRYPKRSLQLSAGTSLPYLLRFHYDRSEAHLCPRLLLAFVVAFARYCAEIKPQEDTNSCIELRYAATGAVQSSSQPPPPLAGTLSPIALRTPYAISAITLRSPYAILAIALRSPYAISSIALRSPYAISATALRIPCMLRPLSSYALAVGGGSVRSVRVPGCYSSTLILK
eukprot:2593560-Rhodomonas_salina.9